MGVNNKANAKCVFNHVFARMKEQREIRVPPLVAMKRQYREWAGIDLPSSSRSERTAWNVEQSRIDAESEIDGIGRTDLSMTQVFNHYFNELLENTAENR